MAKLIATSVNKYTVHILDRWLSSMKEHAGNIDMFFVFYDDSLSLESFPENFRGENPEVTQINMAYSSAPEYMKKAHEFWYFEPSIVAYIDIMMVASGSISRLHSLARDGNLYVGENEGVWITSKEWLDSDEPETITIDTKWDSVYLNSDTRLFRSPDVEYEEQNESPEPEEESTGPMRVAIIGNGPSYRLFELSREKYDLVVACNVPDVDWNKIDFTVIADEKALIKAIRDFETWKFHSYVLGARAIRANDVAKFQPGSSHGLVDGLREAGAYMDSVDVLEGVEDITTRQGYFSSGHLAFKYVVENYDVDRIDLYGFDSIFTGKQTTYSDYVMGGASSKELALNPRNKKHDSPQIWYELWLYMFDKMCIMHDVTFYTFEGHTPIRWDMFKKNVKFVPVLGERNDTSTNSGILR